MVSAGWTFPNVCLFLLVAMAAWRIFKQWRRSEKRNDWIFEQEQSVMREMSKEERASFLLKLPRGFWVDLIKALRGDRHD